MQTAMRMAPVSCHDVLPAARFGRRSGHPSAEYAPIFKWAGGLSKRKINVELFFENESSPLGTTSSEGEGTICNINVPNGKEIYKSDASSGCSFAANKFTFWEVWDKSGDLKLYTRSTAGHTVTVNYEFADDPSKNHSESENVKYAEKKSFGKLDKDYGYEITVSPNDVKYKVDSLNVLWVTGGAKDSEITVTYTPKDVIYIDQYYDNGKLWVKWTGNNIKVNGPELLKGAAEAAVIEGEDLTDAVENYRFLTVDGVTYDFSFASLVPVKGSILQPITDVWYNRDEGTWYYSHTDRKGVLFGLGDRVPVVNRGCVNFCYNTPHNENSKYHDWKWVHDDTTSGADSKHYQVCQRKGCNATSTPVGCNFVDTSIETGTKHTCTVCGYSYTDEITPTGTPVYVYFQTVNTAGEPIENVKGVTPNGNKGGWATLGKLTTKQPVFASTDETVVGKFGAEVKDVTKFAKHQDNENLNLNLDLIKWVELKQDNGAAGYDDAPTWAWHLNGQVNVCKLSYDANRPAGVTANVTVPDSAYYLPGGNATVSTDVPKLQGYVFGGWYKEREFVTEAKGTIAVTEDTVLYAKWTPAQPTADLIDDAITIYHKVSGRSDWHGEDIGANMTYNYTDTNAHPVPKAADAKISYQATLDMSKMMFSNTPEHEETVNGIKLAMVKENKSTIWDYMKDKDIGTFAGSEVNLYVKFSDKLDTNSIDWSKLSLTSDWFRLADGYQNGLTQDSNGYWTIPCVIKAEKGTNNSPIITLSGVSLLLTDTAQDELSSDKDLDIISEGYIDGTIKISGQTLKLESKTAKNTAKLKLAVPTYTVTYRGNGADSGETTDNTAYAPGTTATVKENGFTRSRYTFTGWNMKADGSGTPYKAGEQIIMNNNMILYAQWTRNSSHDNDDDKYFFAIQKVDAQDGHALNDAKFELYQRDKNDRIVNRRVTTTRQQSSKSGIALFSVDNKKSYDGIWYYAEVSAPEGYVLDRTEYEINDKDFFDSLSTAVKYADTVRNYRGTTPDLLNDSDHFAYVIGYMDGNVRPYGLISRAETTTIFFRLLKDSVRDGNLLTSNTYTDVADDYWANTAISTMTGLGIVQGRSTTTFDPKAPITRAQFAAICARFDTGKSNGEQTFTDIKGHWAEKYIQRAAELGWIKGFEDGTFRPDTYITRAQAMTMINRVLNRIPEDESDLLPGMNVWPDCNPGDWFYLTVQEATNSHDFEHKAGNYETWTKLMKNPDWTRYEN